MQKSQKGFTLVELVVVIVLLGILGVTALGRFQDLSADAQTAANAGVASELSSASSINYAALVLNPAAPNATSINTGAEDCASLGALFQTGNIPTDYSITNTGGGTADCTTPGDSFTCDVVSTNTPAGAVAEATIICTP